MFCLPRRQYIKSTSFPVSSAVFVTPAFGSFGGEVKVFLPEKNLIHWSGEHDVLLNEDGTSASLVKAGKYAISVAESDVHINFDVNETQHPIIKKYEVEDASGERCRDGSVKAITNVPELADITVAWNTGHFTKTTTLSNVRPGRYVATILSISGRPVPCIHSCEAAEVGIKID